MNTAIKDAISPVSDAERPPQRDAMHDALDVFLGRWQVEGTAFGAADQPAENPKSKGVSWLSSYEAHWYTGEFFLVHDERAKTGGQTFDTLSVLGVDAKTGMYFAKTFENHGFSRHYEMRREGNFWWLTGDNERAQIEFRDRNRTQVITWEWKPHGRWLPLCDRIARRSD